MLLAAGLAMWIVVAGPVSLSGHPWLCLGFGSLAGALSLIVTHGHVILRQRRRRRVPVAAGRVGAVPRSSTAAGPVDVVPRDELAVVPVDGRTGAAVAFGAAGLFLFSVLFGGLAIWLGVSALRRGTPGRWGRPAAVAAIGLGVVDLVVLVVLLATSPDGAALRWNS